MTAFRMALSQIGFSVDAVTALTDPNIEGVELGHLLGYDDEQLKALCASLRKPGGTIPNPAAGPGVPPNIPNPGVNVSARSKNNHKTLAFMARHYMQTSCDRSPHSTICPVKIPRRIPQGTQKAHEA